MDFANIKLRIAFGLDTTMLLSEFLRTLKFSAAKKSSEFIGTKTDNPAIILEENVSTWTHLTSIEDLQECMAVFIENVCVPDFPARYSPQFWLAHSVLTAIYKVLRGFVDGNFDVELRQETDGMLFELWMRLISAGPGSSHLEMMSIILKNDTSTLWKYMQTLKGDDLKVLLFTLKTDFVYQEDVSADHYATLMETHIDKIFKTILTDKQIGESRRVLLDLYQFYLSKLNHVPPHIGPRLSHLCFLICNRYDKENPYMGVDDWVVMRTHLKVIKDIVTHKSFTVATEAQYRVPKTLEKIFQAAIMDKMLNIMFKDFMMLLETICNYANSRKCEKLFSAYETGLFELLDFKKGFEETPNWLFDQCVQHMAKLCKTVNMETHIDQLILSAQNKCLLKFNKLSSAQVSSWHVLLMNYIVSGRELLVKDAVTLMNSPVLEENNVFEWKAHIDEGRQLIDIISDLPPGFMQKSDDNLVSQTVQQYANFVQVLLSQMSAQNVEGRVRDSVRRCLLKCVEKHVPDKASIALVCLQSGISDLKDLSFSRDILFSIDAALKDDGCPQCDSVFTEVTVTLLVACLDTFRSKGYVSVDQNSLMMSIVLSCLTTRPDQIVETQVILETHGKTNDTNSKETSPETDVFDTVYRDVVMPFVKLHSEKSTFGSISSLVPQVILGIRDNIERWGIIPERSVQFLSELGTICIQLVEDHVTDLLELFLDMECHELNGLLMTLLAHDPQPYLAMFQDIFTKVLSMEHQEKHRGMVLLKALAELHVEIFSSSHVCHLLGTYPVETDETKSLILSTVTLITIHIPGSVASYFNTLSDDSKFSAGSLTERVQIFSCLSRHSEEMCQKTADYLVKFIDSKDGEISSVAMKTLLPILEDKPSYLKKYKPRLTNAWKGSSETKTKEMIFKLLPNIKRTAQPTLPKQPTKESKQLEQSNKYQPQTRSKQIEVVGISGKPVVRPVSQKRPNASRASNVIQVTPKHTKHVSTEIVKSNAKKQSENVASITQDNQLFLDNLKSSKDTRTIDVNSSTTYNTENQAGDQIRTCELMDNVTQSERTVGSVLKTNVLDKRKVPDIPQDLNSKEKLKEIDNVKHETHLAADTHVEKAGLMLCCCLRHKDAMSALSETLANAGYANDVSIVDTDSAVESKLDGTKVMILSTWSDDKVFQSKITKMLSEVNQQDIPLIVVKLDTHIWPPSSFDQKLVLKSVGEKTYVRLHPKKGEECLFGTQFPRLKFHELLMRLNYCGILADNTLVKKKFKNLWNKSERSVSKAHTNVMSQSPTEITPKRRQRASHMATVYISYDWGKQRQIESLYNCLTEQGFHCWISSIEMSGSESLYNKITHGLQCCRVVLACVTKHYHLSEVCQRDIAVAERLGRPVVPLVMGNIKLPLHGDVGEMLNKHSCIAINMDAHGSFDIHSENIDLLKKRLNTIIDGRNTDEPVIDNKPLVVVDATDNNNEENNRQIGENPNYGTQAIQRVHKSKLHTSTSLFDIETISQKGTHSEKARTRDDILMKRRSLPHGIILDDDGYTMKSERSKSCVIL